MSHQLLQASLVSKGIAGWMGLVMIIMVASVHESPNTKFFRMGPHEDLAIFGIAIDTGAKYTLIFLYTCVSTVVRTLQQEVLRPWIIQKVQNDHEKELSVRKDAYMVVTIETMYIWFDWFMYINILLAQVDLMIVEVIGNLAAVWFTTMLYLQQSKHNRVPSVQEGIPAL